MVTGPELDEKIRKASSLSELEDIYKQARDAGLNDRARYTLVRRNQATIGKVNDILKQTAERAFAPLGRLSQQGAGALFRSTVPGLIDEFGNFNAQVAKTYYETQRELAYAALRGQGYSRGGLVPAAKRRAAATFAGQAYVAKVPDFDIRSQVESIVGYGMKSFTQYGAAQASANVENALTRAVAAYNRDTLLFNSALDPAVVGVQRVAEPDACEFCQMVAFDQTGSVRVSGYAADYHNHCRCSIETLYAGDTPYRPDYYDDFEYGSVRSIDNLPEYMQDNTGFVNYVL